MKKFVFKSLTFLSPVIILYIFTALFYQTGAGDLIRVGYIKFDLNYRKVFSKEFEKGMHFTRLSECNDSISKFDVLTIGDSFSEQDNYGYQNYLAENCGMDILHFDRFFQLNKMGNPFQILYGLLNGDLLNQIEIDYIILEATEKSIIFWGNNIDTTQIILYRDFVNLTKSKNNRINKLGNNHKFLSDRIIKFPLFNLLYILDDNAYISGAYRVKTTEQLFSVDRNELIFSSGDLEHIELNNNFESVINLNKVLNNLANKLKSKGIKLLVMPAPDKYDIYYDYIADKKRYKKPLFFNHMEKIQKEYLYINPKTILGDEISKKKKDIYFYDDTHWSPWASQLVANELAKIICKQD